MNKNSLTEVIENETLQDKVKLKIKKKNRN